MSQHSTERSASGALMPALLLFGGITLMLMAAFAARPSQHQYTGAELTATAETRAANMTATTAAVEEIALAATATVQAAQSIAQVTALDPAMIAKGEHTFQSVCAACHGFSAQGIAGLGKPLVNSAFVDDLSDDDLAAFIIKGREVSDPANTTGVPMPARGGNPGLSDDDMRNVVAYIRSLNIASGVVAAAPSPVPVFVGPTPTPYVFVPLPLSAGDDTDTVAPTPVPSRFASPGEEWYVRSCAGCHGVDGSGLAYLATAHLADSDLVSSRDGFGLLNFLTKAGPPVNPEVAYPHPYRGGYPELTDAQIQGVIVYLYTLSR
jgi:mono/diheme cytochrome c family protein